MMKLDAKVMKGLENYSVKALKDMCKMFNLKGYSKLSKEGLVSFIRANVQSEELPEIIQVNGQSNNKEELNMNNDLMNEMVALLSQSTTEVIKSTVVQQTQEVIVPAINVGNDRVITTIVQELNTIKAMLANQSTKPAQRFYQPTNNKPIYGKCSCCGTGITSERVVSFSQRNFCKALCMACQNKAKAGTGFNMGQPSPQQAPAQPATQQVTVACTHCGQSLTYANKVEAEKSKHKATQAGLASGYYHANCAKAILAQVKPQPTPVQPPTGFGFVPSVGGVTGQAF